MLRRLKSEQNTYRLQGEVPIFPQSLSKRMEMFRYKQVPIGCHNKREKKTQWSGNRNGEKVRTRMKPSRKTIRAIFTHNRYKCKRHLTQRLKNLKGEQQIRWKEGKRQCNSFCCLDWKEWCSPAKRRGETKGGAQGVCKSNGENTTY